MLFCCHSSCAQYQIKDLQSSGGGLSLDLDGPSTPSRVQKKIKSKYVKKYMYYISDFLKN